VSLRRVCINGVNRTPAAENWLHVRRFINIYLDGSRLSSTHSALPTRRGIVQIDYFVSSELSVSPVCAPAPGEAKQTTLMTDVEL
jgi:hypothetical protein